MQTPAPQAGSVADAPPGNWVDRYAPEWLRPYARLARWDRPIGFWLLFWPCAFALALAAQATEGAFDLRVLVLCLIGAIAMRGAGCTLNDIVDADIDAMVERTRNRPVAAGHVSMAQATGFLAAQLALGLIILLQLNPFTWVLGASSLALVAVYPFMKRVTWWPQFFLGLAFSWGALLGWAAVTGSVGLPALTLYAGCVLWVIGYDTIYALQDVEDDVMVGVKSTARLFGRRVRVLVGLFYAGAVALWALSGWQAGAGAAFFGALVVPAAMLGWQVATLDGRATGNALARFKSNHWVGLVLTLSLLAGSWA